MCATLGAHSEAQPRRAELEAYRDGVASDAGAWMPWSCLEEWNERDIADLGQCLHLASHKTMSHDFYALLATCPPPQSLTAVCIEKLDNQVGLRYLSHAERPSVSSFAHACIRLLLLARTPAGDGIASDERVGTPAHLVLKECVTLIATADAVIKHGDVLREQPRSWRKLYLATFISGMSRLTYIVRGYRTTLRNLMPPNSRARRLRAPPGSAVTTRLHTAMGFQQLCRGLDAYMRHDQDPLHVSRAFPDHSILLRARCLVSAMDFSTLPSPRNEALPGLLGQCDDCFRALWSFNPGTTDEVRDWRSTFVVTMRSIRAAMTQDLLNEACSVRLLQVALLATIAVWVPESAAIFGELLIIELRRQHENNPTSQIFRSNLGLALAVYSRILPNIHLLSQQRQFENQDLPDRSFVNHSEQAYSRSRWSAAEEAVALVSSKGEPSHDHTTLPLGQVLLTCGEQLLTNVRSAPNLSLSAVSAHEATRVLDRAVSAFRLGMSPGLDGPADHVRRITTSSLGVSIIVLQSARNLAYASTAKMTQSHPDANRGGGGSTTHQCGVCQVTRWIVVSYAHRVMQDLGAAQLPGAPERLDDEAAELLNAIGLLNPAFAVEPTLHAAYLCEGLRLLGTLRRKQGVPIEEQKGLLHQQIKAYDTAMPDACWWLFTEERTRARRDLKAMCTVPSAK